MGKEIDPSDIGKYPEIIKKAQSEMTNMDVLVCGQCNCVFHFVEQFRDHKSIRCIKESTLKDNLETKPVIWSFLLWKSSQLSQDQNKDQTNVNAWRLYQSWMKLDEAIKETWVVAGRTIQSFAKIGEGNLQEMPVKITKTVVDNSDAPLRNKQIIANRVVNKIPGPTPKELDASFNELKNSDASPVKRQIIRTPQTKTIVNRPIANKPGVIARKATRTLASNANSTETTEHIIEKILAKRFNPRHKEHEYLIKWDNVSHELNTWEPASHLDSCPILLDTFEKQLARQKEQRIALAAKQAQAQTEIEIKNEPSKEDSQSEDDGTTSNIKRRKLDTAPTTKLITKVDSVNTANRISQANKAKSNGFPVAPVAKSNEKSAEVVITTAKDGKQTGIVKRTGVTVNPVQKNEAQIKVIPKGGDSISGVVRVSAANRVVHKLGNTTVKSVPNTGRVVQRVQAKAIPARASSVQQLVTSLTQEPHAAIKPTITRVVKSAPNSKNTTPEQKIAALTRQGNLKITRKTVNAQVNAQPILIQDDEEFNINNSFDLTPKLDENQIQQQISENDIQMVPVSLDNTNTNLALLNATLEPNLNVKKEVDVELANAQEIINQQQQQQLQQSSGIISDQDGLQQIFASNEDGSQQLIQFVTGEDGTIYQVAGKNEQGQTVLIAQGADGEQQCVYVAAEDDLIGGDDPNSGVMTTIDGNLVDAGGNVHQLQQHLVADEQTGIHYSVEGDENVQGVTQPLQIATEDGDSQDGQITAEVVQADLPSPGKLESYLHLF